MTHVLEMSKLAQEFYEKGRSRSLVSGYERNVLVRPDFNNALFVDANYNLQPGDYVFRCQTINQQTVISLKSAIPQHENLAEIALKGIFTHVEWLAMIEVTNGLLFSPEIDPRQQLAGELDDDFERGLIEKIEALPLVSAKMLMREISDMWVNNIPVETFIERFI